VRVDPGRTVTPSLPPGTRLLEWLAEGALSRNERPLALHAPVASEDDSATYRNSASEPAVLFRCICPPPLDPAST
jgi:hypothetical protein